MNAKHRHLSRRQRATSLLPLAVLSAAWTVGVATADSASTSDSADATPAYPSLTAPRAPVLPDLRPASVPGLGAFAASVRYSTAGAVSSGDASGIPSAALGAYQRAAQVIAPAYVSCHLPWEILAAIGRVESDHGQAGGSVLGSDGVSAPGIYGPELDGRGGTQSMADTDAGVVDHDPVHDRAVGPMQFLPGTWSAVKVDADGDGVRNPQDIDDAALAAAVYLCSAGEDLSTDGGRQAALLRYNRSASYGRLVMRVAEAYAVGQYSALPSGTYAGGTLVSKPAHRTSHATHAPGAAPATSTAGAPAASAHEPAAQPTTASGSSGGSVRSIVGNVVKDPAGSVGTAIPVVLTRAQATVFCLQQGISSLDLVALTRCVTDLLTD